MRPKLLKRSLLATGILVVLMSPAVLEAQTLYACAHNQNGQMRLVLSSEACKKEETRVQWPLTAPLLAQQVRVGPEGPMGPIGPMGPTGAQGATGATGAQGATGATGAPGATGATGATGAQGPQGETGAMGATGAAGATGATGAAGVDGTNGINGTNGKDGKDGHDGLNGLNGANGLDGATGATGQRGPTGPAGTTGQNAMSLFSQRFLLFDVISGGGPAFIPGLYGKLTVPADSVVVFSSQGGIENTGVRGDHVRVAIRLLVDDIIQEFGEYDIEVGLSAKYGRWSLSVAVSNLPAGDHMVGVQAQMTDIHRASTATPFPRALVGGTSDSPVHGTLTAIVLKQ